MLTLDQRCQKRSAFRSPARHLRMHLLVATRADQLNNHRINGGKPVVVKQAMQIRDALKAPSADVPPPRLHRTTPGRSLPSQSGEMIDAAKNDNTVFSKVSLKNSKNKLKKPILDPYTGGDYVETLNIMARESKILFDRGSHLKEIRVSKYKSSSQPLREAWPLFGLRV